MVHHWYTMKLIKEVVKVGNTGGVLVPREWVNGRVELKLVERPLAIESDVLALLKSVLSDVKGIYLVGSYARGEQTKRSDVDILVITGKTSRKITHANYHLILISEEELKEQLSLNALPLLPMLVEAKPILNESLAQEYKSTPLTHSNINWHLETTRSALDVLRAALALDDATGTQASDDTVYSLILRLRGVYIVDCLQSHMLATKKGLLALLETMCNSTAAYDAYLRSKDGKRAKHEVSTTMARKILDHIEEAVDRQEAWAEQRG